MTYHREQVGDLLFASRKDYRPLKVVEKAYKRHKKLGRDLTEYSEKFVERVVKEGVPDFKCWGKIDLLAINDGVKLPEKPGLYGFFNLRPSAAPKERILYIGKSTKGLHSRVSRNHSKFIESLRFGATHVCYITYNTKDYPDPLEAKATITRTETCLIQYWAPYLNRAENPFNYEIEDISFAEKVQPSD